MDTAAEARRVAGGFLVAHGRPSGFAAAGRHRQVTATCPPRRFVAALPALAALLFAWPCALLAADWPTSRGNLQRTGCIDGKAGPKAPQVAWVFRSRESFLSAPVVGDKALYVTSLGPFNIPSFMAVSLERYPAERVLWSKKAPCIKLPLVCAPAVVGGRLYFGDGMHQTDGGTVHCLDEASGRMVWQHAVPGKLVHLEGSPAVAGGRLVMGGGAAGVFCLDVNRVTFLGREMSAADAARQLDERWKKLLADYEEQKKKDADLAIPPNEDALPKPAPRKLWQQGAEKWHVDGPVAVVGDRVLAGSAFLDEEKVGQRAFLCLRLSDGGTLWETELKHNPWADAALAGDTIVVGTSHIRFDPNQIDKARGEVLGLNLADGKVKWRLDLPGGVLCAPAVKNDLAVFCATDGKVRAVKASTGQPVWTYDAGRPFFAGVAIAGDVAYAVDLKAAVHALALADGKPLWTHDLAKDPAVSAQGMVFESPVVQDGRIYLATTDMEGPGEGKFTVVVCLGDKDRDAPEDVLTVDKAARTIRLPCKVAPRKLADLKEIYPLEVVATWPAPRGQKAHETVVTFEVKPSAVHKALEDLGLKPGAPGRGEAVASGPVVRLFLEFPPAVPGLRPRRVPVEKTLIDRRTGKAMPPLQWRFTGSALRQLDPARPEKTYGADLAGTLITIFPVTEETVFQSDLALKDASLLALEVNPRIVPAVGTRLTLLIEVAP